MTKPRYAQVSLAETPWYHIVSRCVRRAFLCGVDSRSGQSYEHRREWVEKRIKQLAAIFTIDVAAFAVMHNHYHIIVRIDSERVAELTTTEIISRWAQLYRGPLILHRYLGTERQKMDPAELRQVETLAEGYRKRLCDLSWFMKNLNEYISRKANGEDQAKGHFWESRYKCQALLDEAALLTAMAYVDLNPIRAAMAETPESSEHTSIRQRINELKDPGVAELAPAAPPRKDSRDSKKIPQPAEAKEAPLLPFAPGEDLPAAIPFAFTDYLELLDSVGRAVHPARRGFIPEQTPAILVRLGIDIKEFIAHADHFLVKFGNSVGAPAKLTELAAARNARYLRGIGKSRQLFAGLQAQG